jgi:hypothetical protein
LQAITENKKKKVAKHLNETDNDIDTETAYIL